MKGLLIDVNESKVRKVKASTLAEYRKLIGCSYIDILNVRIGDRFYDVICDDEGQSVMEPIVSAVSVKDGIAVGTLVGNLLICGSCDEDGNETDLSEDDISKIKKAITWRLWSTESHFRSVPLLRYSWR